VEHEKHEGCLHGGTALYPYSRAYILFVLTISMAYRLQRYHALLPLLCGPWFKYGYQIWTTKSRELRAVCKLHM
jgi:hypothetical protein